MALLHLLYFSGCIIGILLAQSYVFYLQEKNLHCIERCVEVLQQYPPTMIPFVSLYIEGYHHPARKQYFDLMNNMFGIEAAVQLANPPRICITLQDLCFTRAVLVWCTRILLGIGVYISFLYFRSH